MSHSTKLRTATTEYNEYDVSDDKITTGIRGHNRRMAY